MSANPKLYSKTVITGPQKRPNPVMSKTYKGFSTISTESNSYSLYDFALIKQDIINHFHMRQGEKLENPLFGTIIWDLLFEPLTEEVKQLIIKDVETIINYDPRVRAENVIVTTYESGIQVECSITYLIYNVQEALTFRFDQANGIAAN
jgi:phage baseplate assembly protein W